MSKNEKSCHICIVRQNSFFFAKYEKYGTLSISTHSKIHPPMCWLTTFLKITYFLCSWTKWDCLCLRRCLDKPALCFNSCTLPLKESTHYWSGSGRAQFWPRSWLPRLSQGSKIQHFRSWCHFTLRVTIQLTSMSYLTKSFTHPATPHFGHFSPKSWINGDFF